jgi:iduronate 2-sulfatase
MIARILLLSLAGSLMAAAATQPNVLFIVADDYRPELHSYGSAAITPNLDRLAKRSLQFQRAYCQQAVCNPSRSSFLTGKRPDSLKLWNNGTHFRELNPDVITLPQWFMQQGYNSRCVGKIFHNWHTKDKGDRRSWSADEFLHFANHGDDNPMVQGDIPPNLSTANIRPYNTQKCGLCEKRDVPDEAYYDGRVAAEAVRVLPELKDSPFFLAVGFWKPHAPFNAPKKYWDMYDSVALPKLDATRPSGAPELAFHKSTEILGPVGKQVLPNAEQAAEWRKGYFANISYMDAQIGKVLDQLDALKLTERTIVVFISDHGYHLGEHDLWAKTSNFEYDARVPMMISLPGMSSAGLQTQALAELVDLFPTLTDLCKLPKPSGLDGSSLAPLLAKPEAQVDEAAYTQHPRPAYFDREPGGQPHAMGYSVRTLKVRYTEWRDWKTKEVVARELYDESQQPAELMNRIDDAALSEAQAEAVRLLRKQFQ